MKAVHFLITMITINDITIKIKMFNKPKLIAQATVIFSDIVETKSWKIMPSTKMHPRFQEEIWIQPPSYPRGRNIWGLTVWINDRDLYEQVEDKIYDAFCMTRNKESGEEGVAEAVKQDEEINVPENLEDINPDDIPL